MTTAAKQDVDIDLTVFLNGGDTAHLGALGSTRGALRRIQLSGGGA